MEQYILAIDQGTTGTTALLFDSELNIRAKVNHEFPQHFPKPNWVEHDLEEIWESVVNAVSGALAQSQISAQNIAAIGITNQRETTCLWMKDQKATPVHKAIVWQDRRTAEYCAKLKKKGLEKAIYRKTGLLLDPYFSGTKLNWLLKNVPSAKKLAQNGQVAFGTIDSYLLYRLTGEHRTDVSNASRTLLMDLKTCQWDEDLLKTFKIPKNILPEILPNAVEYGKTRDFPGLPDGIPVTALIGDQQAALFGQACFQKGSAKCTYGTGAFALVNTGNAIIHSKCRLLTTVGWKLNGKTTYCVEGSAFIAGAAVQWLRDGLEFFKSSHEVEMLAESVSDSDGVVFVPALSGMGAPHWLPHASGMFTGLSRRTTRGHIARAALEGIAFQVAELMSAMQKDYGKKIVDLKVDGGASSNDLMMQFQADLMGIKTTRSKIIETTALGAGLQAGLAIGYWKDLAEIEKKWKASGSFKPAISTKVRKNHLERWNKAMGAVKLLAK